jgi:hypothetical protein
MRLALRPVHESDPETTEKQRVPSCLLHSFFILT